MSFLRSTNDRENIYQFTNSKKTKGKNRRFGSGLNCEHMSLSRLRLEGAQLWKSNFTDSDLSNAILNDCDLKWSLFVRTDLTWTKFERADLRWADFRSANMVYSDLFDAKLFGSIFDQFTVFPFSFDEAIARGMVFVHTDGFGTNLLKIFNRNSRRKITAENIVPA